MQDVIKAQTTRLAAHTQDDRTHLCKLIHALSLPLALSGSTWPARTGESAHASRILALIVHQLSAVCLS